jgi:ABC-type Zn2+ transport system substrate-binding protein/surface adhesin
MKFVLAWSLALASYSLIACGGSRPAEAQHADNEHEHEHHHGHHEGHDKDEHEERGEHDAHEKNEQISPALKDFHAVLAPVWHSHAGDERIDKACARSAAFKEKAAAVADAELSRTVDKLAETCAPGAKRDGVEASLGAVHERFHALAEKH